MHVFQPCFLQHPRLLRVGKSCRKPPHSAAMVFLPILALRSRAVLHHDLSDSEGGKPPSEATVASLNCIVFAEIVANRSSADARQWCAKGTFASTHWEARDSNNAG